MTLIAWGHLNCIYLSVIENCARTMFSTHVNRPTCVPCQRRFSRADYSRNVFYTQAQEKRLKTRRNYVK